ncbi:hypothetical protein MCOR10_001023 [Pyricularia oryzae]|nr:hypothetical protein MCOR10_001023 [Pyricularia oryzae]KAI6545605.1 hypothetical protein MCOR05_001328 [Pyricularia oryzae]
MPAQVGNSGTSNTNTNSNSSNNNPSKYALLPACQRCKLRKIRCDRQAPKCSGCTKSQAACVVVDPITSERYHRSFIHELEERERELQGRISAASGAAIVTPSSETAADAENPARPATGSDVGRRRTGTDEQHTPGGQVSVSDSPTAHRGFVGDGSGLSFLRFIFQDPRWRSYEPQIMQLLAERPQIPELAISSIPQPPREEATALLDNYFLLRQDVQAIFDRIYNGAQPQPPSPQDYFRLLMVFSISAVTRYRKGKSSEHPYGYYLTAQEYMSQITLIGSVDAIQNLLLVCRFGQYYHIGTSLWEISQFCMRQCVEQDLHKPPRSRTDSLQEQHRRRIFWECYISDRHSSGILGRPFAIAEADIAAHLPVDVGDDAITRAVQEGKTSLSQLTSREPTAAPTEVSVFIFCIRLRRISSKIHSAFYSGRGVSPVDGSDCCTTTTTGTATAASITTSGHVYVQLHRFLDELAAWRRDAPTFSSPRSLYERSEWYDFLLEKDRLLLVRGAIHRAPRRSHDRPPEDLLAMCHGYAARVVELYDGMLRGGHITWTRGYFQVIFAAGLSVIYCVSLGLHRRAGVGVEVLETTRRALGLCSDILMAFKREMPDAGRFAVVFGILKDHLLRDHGSSLPTVASTGAAAGAQVVGGGGGGGGGSLEQDGAHPDNLATVVATTSSDAAAADGGNSSASHVLPPADVAMMDWQHQRHHPEDEDPYAAQQAGQQSLFDPAVGEAMAFCDGASFGTIDPVQGTWPVLTDEVMEQLEAGLDEFAWGCSGIDGFY